VSGDPLFYGSFAGIYSRLTPRYKVTIVPGVSSLTACAAVAGLLLAQRRHPVGDPGHPLRRN
jgi:precorrin-2/cobalt-factor-2 C20-methyltransferase